MARRIVKTKSFTPAAHAAPELTSWLAADAHGQAAAVLSDALDGEMSLTAKGFTLLASAYELPTMPATDLSAVLAKVELDDAGALRGYTTVRGEFLRLGNAHELGTDDSCSSARVLRNKVQDWLTKLGNGLAAEFA